MRSTRADDASMWTQLPPRRTSGAGRRITSPLVATAVLLGLLVPVAPAASAETVDLSRTDAVVLDGRGYGHGRGMSQNGAQGAASQGLDHRAILGFYYPGTEVYDAGDPTVRVKINSSALSDAEGPFTALSGPLLVLDDLGRGTSTPLPAGTSSCRVRPAGAGTRATCEGGASAVTVETSAVRLRGGAGGIGLALGPGTTRYYRGSVTVQRESAGVVGIVSSSMQEYLRGVVPLEVPASWRAEALRAQTVAARTYALRTMADRPAGSSWDICDSTACQVFQGMRTTSGTSTTTHEHSATDAAIDSTRGVALRHQGRPAFTQFSAANGGSSAGSPAHPYLVARPDPYDGVTGSTSHRWTTTVPVARIRAAWPSVGQPLSMTVLTRDGNGEWGGRALSVRVVGTSGSVTVTGEQVRTALGLRSTWWSLSVAAPSEPYGNLDGVTRVPGGATVSGWAVDPDSPAAVAVHVYVDGVGAATTTASLPRSDVAAAHPAAGPDRGFALTVPVTAPGAHTVCAYAVNIGAGSGNTTLGCTTVTVGMDPSGALDEARAGFGAVTARGWAWDPDSAGATTVHVYLDGAPVSTTATGSPRPDVHRRWPEAGPSRGWAATVPARPGAHRLCAYGISTGGGTNRLLGCRDVTVSGAPVGALDKADPVQAGVEVAGWAADPDTTGPVGVHTYASGRGRVSSTSVPRPDVARVLGAAHARTGFAARVPALGGTQQVCSYGIDVGGSSNALLGCRSTTVPSVAFGHVDSVTWAGGRLGVTGWALDPDVTAPIAVHVYADGAFVGSVAAAAPRPDVRAAHPLHGAAHGFATTLPLAGRPGTVCAYAIDVTNPAAGTVSTNPLLGCLAP